MDSNRKAPSEESSVATSEEHTRSSFTDKVLDRFGRLPNFFRTAAAAPGLMEELWKFAQVAYFDSPLSSLFKERLLVYLSRFCPVRYCVVRHAGFLIGQGYPAGDKNAKPQTVADVLALLKCPAPEGGFLETVYERLYQNAPFSQLPLPGTREEEALFVALAVLFLEPRSGEKARAALKAALGETMFEMLTAYLAFVRMLHYWTETHPEIELDEDMLAVLQEEKDLAVLLLDTAEATRIQVAGRLRDELLQSQQRYHMLFNSIDEGFYIGELLYDRAGQPIDLRYLEVNKAFEIQTGLKVLPGQLGSDVTPGLEPHWFAAYDQVVKTGKPVHLENYHAFTDCWFSANVFKFQGNSANQFAVAFTDSTEHKKAEDALRKSEEKFRTLFTTMDQGFCLIEVIFNAANTPVDYRFLEINPAFERLTGIKNAVGRRMKEIAPLHEEHWFHIYGDIAITGMPRRFESEAVQLGRHYDVYAFRFGDPGEKNVAVLFTDITERVTAHIKLEESEAFTRKALESSPDCVKILDTEGRISFMNNNGRCLMEIDDFATVQNRFWWDLWGEENRTVVTEAVIAALNGKSGRFTAFCPTAKGTAKWWDVMVSPVFDNRNKVSQIISVSRDISESREARRVLEENEAILQTQVTERTKDLADANNSLLQSNRELLRSNQNLEQFAHAASHDLKEPVRKIHFFTNLLKDQLAPHLNEPTSRTFGRIENAAKRMGDLIDDLLIYSHVTEQPLVKESVNLNESMIWVLEDLELDIQERKAVVRVDNLPTIQGYRRQLQQLFQNLISNAIKYTAAGEIPEVTITASRTKMFGRLHHCISVVDKGIGFEQEHAKKIFQMFARLHGKDEYSGTGIGLSIAKKVAENHEGFLQAESAPGEGATFKVYLPA